MGAKAVSKYDPYIEDIKVLVSSGLTIEAIAISMDQYFDDPVDASGLYGFMVSRGIWQRKDKPLKADVPVCDRCEHCYEIIKCSGKTGRACFGHYEISDKVKTSPSTCFRRTV